MKRPRIFSRWFMVGLFGLLGVGYGAAGWVMAATFAVSDPVQMGHWQMVAWLGVGLAGVSFAAIVVSLLALRRERAARTRVDSPSGRST